MLCPVPSPKNLQEEYLAKHDKETTSFFQSLTAQSFHSEAAEALRTRLLKYQEKLFTFIHYDGVPWNNNNAEHAIKQFRTTGSTPPGCCERRGSVITWCC
jgi:hypothetical protein